MLFPTATFAIFFLIVLPLSWLAMPKPARWRPFILIASYVFYSWWDWRFVFLLAGCTIWNQVLAVRIHRATTQQQKKLLLWVALAGNLGVLGYFKYYDFFVDVVAEHGATIVGLELPLSLKTIILPVGISFFTFQAISYVVDIYRGDFDPDHHGKFAVYLVVLPAPRRRPDRAARRADPAARRRRATRGGVDTSRGLLPDRDRAVQEGRDRELPRGQDRRPGVRRARPALVARDPDRRSTRYAVQIYADFSRLHRHRDRLRAAARLPFPAELRLAVRRDVDPGLLAPLAHDAVALAARLPLHPARRQPQGQDPHLPQPDAHDAARRALARRRLDVRRLGRHPRRRARRRAPAEGPRRATSSRRTRAGDGSSRG